MYSNCGFSGEMCVDAKMVGLNKKTFGAVFICTIYCQCVLPLRRANKIYLDTHVLRLYIYKIIYIICKTLQGET